MKSLLQEIPKPWSHVDPSFAISHLSWLPRQPSPVPGQGLTALASRLNKPGHQLFPHTPTPVSYNMVMNMTVCMDVPYLGMSREWSQIAAVIIVQTSGLRCPTQEQLELILRHQGLLTCCYTRWKQHRLGGPLPLTGEISLQISTLSVL